MKSLNIYFAVNGSVKQEIEIFNEDTEKEFFEKIKTGTYLVSISSGDVIEIPSFKKVGAVIDQTTLEDTEFSDFELIEE